MLKVGHLRKSAKSVEKPKTHRPAKAMAEFTPSVSRNGLGVFSGTIKLLT